MKLLKGNEYLRWIAGIVLTIGSAFFLNFQYSKLHRLNLLKSTHQDIHQIINMNTNLDESILKSRFYFLEHYDFLANNVNREQEAIIHLESVFADKSNDLVEFQEYILEIKNKFRQKESYIDLFKSKNSIYKNSQLFLPLLLDEFFEKVHKRGGNHELEKKLEDMSNLILHYIIRPTESQKKELLQLQKEIMLEAKFLGRDSKNQLNMHLNIVINESIELDRVLRNILSGEVKNKLTKLSDIISKEIMKSEQERSLFYFFIGLLSLFLLGLVINFFFKLQKSNSRLEQRVIERTQELSEAIEVKSRFLATMSHEIRTPMNAVLSCANLLADNITDSENVRLLNTIQHSGDTLLTLINDILDLSKIESGNLEIENEAFCIADNTMEIINLLEVNAFAKGIKLSCDIGEEVPVWIMGDVTRFRQVLTNLIGNAIKFTKSFVKVNIKSKNISEKYEILVSIVDDGIGISEEAKEKLFKEFSQVDASTTRKFGGTGLGLAICKGIIEKMGGNINVSSELNSGSTFFFSFMAEKAAKQNRKLRQKISEINPNMGKLHPLKILMAEDNSVNQMVGRKILEKLGYKIDIVANGMEAVNAALTNSYDVILMDQHMPEMDGIEATVEIRKHKKNTIKIFALTASAFKEDKDRCLRAGMDGFMTKPIEIDEIVSALKECQPNKRSKVGVMSNNNVGPDVIDFDTLYAQFSGMSDLVQDLVQQCLECMPDYIVDIKKAIDQRDFESLKLSAHTLKGTAANLRANAVVEAALKLEVAGKEKNEDDLEGLLQSLECEMKKLYAELNEMLKKHIA